MTDLPRAWWHGCWERPGHYLYDVNGRSGRDMEPCPIAPSGSILDAGWLDGGLAPRRVKPMVWLPSVVPPYIDGILFKLVRGKEFSSTVVRESEECAQGEFLLHAIAGCTIAAWWDRTQGDERGGCNSCLIVEGGHNASDMMELFPRIFPRQAKRLADAGVELKFLRWGSPP